MPTNLEQTTSYSAMYSFDNSTSLGVVERVYRELCLFILQRRALIYILQLEQTIFRSNLRQLQSGLSMRSSRLDSSSN